MFTTSSCCSVLNFFAHELVRHDKPLRSAKRANHLEEVVFNQIFALCLAQAWIKFREKVGFFNAIVDPGVGQGSFSELLLIRKGEKMNFELRVEQLHLTSK